MASLYELQGTMLQIEQTLDDNGGELTAELAALLSDTEMSIKQKADGYRAIMAKFNDKAEAADKEIKRLQDIKRVAKNAEKRMREYILSVMGMYGIKKIEGDLCTMTRTTSTALEVDEEVLLSTYNSQIAELQEKLPNFLTVEVKVSKTGIKNMFKNSDILPAGCEYVENESLRIR